MKMRFFVVQILLLTAFIKSCGGGQSPHFVTVKWNAEPTAAYFSVYRSSTAAGPFAKLNPGMVIGNVYTDSSVTGGLSYFYKITASNQYGTSPYSSVVTVTVP